MFSYCAFSQELTLKQVKEMEQITVDIIKNGQTEENSNEIGKTPLSTIITISEALIANDFKTAGEFLDLRFVNIENKNAENLIRQLSIIWSKQHILDISTLSNDPNGHIDDGLPSYRDLLGVIKFGNDRVPIYLQRVPDSQGGKIWKISNYTVSKIPKLWNEFGYHPLAESIAQYLPSFTIFDMENWQFVSFFLILVISWYITALIRWLMLKLVTFSNTYKLAFQKFIRVPVRMFLYFILIQWLIGQLGLSVSARIWLDSGAVNYLAAVFITLGIIEFIFAFYSNRKSENKNLIGVMRPVVTTLKIAVVVVMILNWFDDAGFDINTILAGLGIGSFAIALAAQKSLENVIGAMTILIAKPIKPGDLCCIGDVMGVVEEIGLRSTIIRKLNRTVVHVPNSVIISEKIENFTEIDYRQYSKNIRIRLITPPEKMRILLSALETLITNNEMVLDFDSRVRFEAITEDAFIIAIFAYIDTRLLSELKAFEEDINLKILEIIRINDIDLAIPERQISIIDKTKSAVV